MNFIKHIDRNFRICLHILAWSSSSRICKFLRLFLSFSLTLASTPSSLFCYSPSAQATEAEGADYRIISASPQQTPENNNNNKVKARKRTRDLELRKEYSKKSRVQKGIEHISKRNKIIPARKFEAQRKCVCSKGCSGKTNIERQLEIFNDYYTLENWTTKTIFLRSTVICYIEEM